MDVGRQQRQQERQTPQTCIHHPGHRPAVRHLDALPEPRTAKRGQREAVHLPQTRVALDEAAQEGLEATIAARLPTATLISLSQRPRAASGGTQRYEIARTGEWASVRPLAPALA